jgi:hypothetical protein
MYPSPPITEMDSVLLLRRAESRVNKYLQVLEMSNQTFIDIMFYHNTCMSAICEELNDIQTSKSISAQKSVSCSPSALSESQRSIKLWGKNENYKLHF